MLKDIISFMVDIGMEKYFLGMILGVISLGVPLVIHGSPILTVTLFGLCPIIGAIAGFSLAAYFIVR